MTVQTFLSTTGSGIARAVRAIWYVSVSVCPWQAHSAGSAEAYIFRWSGDAWLKLGGGLPQPLNDMPYSLLADPAAPGHVYAGLGNGDVWHTMDHGDTWQRLPFNVGGVQHSLVMLSS
jgi:hypothetical protein